MKIGKNTVIIGTLPENSEIGDGNVIISSFDIIKDIKEIGCNAKADFGAIAIGCNARAITVLKRS